MAVHPTECGECRLCCKLMRIHELDKPPYTWCGNACSKGCGIYEDRPQSCREFECIWLGSQGTNHAMAVEFKPSVCGAVMTTTKDGKSIVVHFNDGVDVRGGKLALFIHQMSMTLRVILRRRDKMTIVHKGKILGETIDPRMMEEGTNPDRSIDVMIPDYGFTHALQEKP